MSGRFEDSIRAIVREEIARAEREHRRRLEVYNFCRKQHNDVRLLIQSASWHRICDECVELSMKILREKGIE
jgi:hypothetical protein